MKSFIIMCTFFLSLVNIPLLTADGDDTPPARTGTSGASVTGEFSHEAPLTSPRDSATGLPAGKSMYKPFNSTQSEQTTSPDIIGPNTIVSPDNVVGPNSTNEGQSIIAPQNRTQLKKHIGQPKYE